MTDRIALGRRAASLLEDQTFNEVLDVIKADLVNAWAASPATDRDTRESFYLAHRAIGSVRAELAKMRDEALMAEAQAEQAEQDRRFSAQNMVSDE